jgi:hypothetical protein
MQEQFTRAIQDIDAGAGTVDIHIQFNIPGGA